MSSHPLCNHPTRHRDGTMSFCWQKKGHDGDHKPAGSPPARLEDEAIDGVALQPDDALRVFDRLHELEAAKSKRLTQEQIESLPQFARDWIYDLETRCDPAGELAELRLMQDTVKAQQVLIEELKAAQKK